ncbi:MAG: hypothetical protein BWY54_00368 [Candidatus Dependentiae bacterium ADurb.Bin331]|nr:MAG: hypothetical protein BWY54_00368 [Candidatus Dependentiae bacterium ADurb.Bin331]
MVTTFTRLYLILCMIHGSLSAARNDHETFLQAKQAYEHNELQKAVDLFKTIEKKGDAVWYNMGVCAFEQGDKAQALFYWHQAKKNASSKSYPHIEQAIMSIEQPNSSIKSSILRFLQLNSTYLGVGGWQLVVLIGLFALLLIWFFVKRIRNVLLIGVALIVFYSSILLVLAYGRTVDKVLIVKADRTPLFIAPDDQLGQIDIIDRGRSVVVLKKEDSWYKIGYLNKYGWMHADSFIEI